MIEDLTKFRALCEAAGWRHYSNSEKLREWCGDGNGIAHGPTVDGWEYHSDSVYASWMHCYFEAVHKDNDRA